MVSTAFFSSRSSAQGYSVVSAEDVDSFWCDLNPEIVTKLDLVCLQLRQDYTQVLSIGCKRHDRDVAEGLELVRRRIDYGHSELAMKPLQLRAHIVAKLGIEIGQWLVEQQDLGMPDQCAAERHALLFAARQGVGLAVEPVRQPQHLRSLLHASFDVGGGRLLLAQRIGEIIVDGE